MMLFVTSMISLSLQCVSSAPQLRLSHTGYEIISFNDQTPDESLPVLTKLASQNTSRYSGLDFLNLEKAETTIDDETEVVLPVQQHKRDYDSPRSTPISKASSETRRNTVVPFGKLASSELGEKTDVYLAVGVPTGFDRPSSSARDSSSVLSSSDAASSGGGSKNSFEDPRREKTSSWSSPLRLHDRETEAAKKPTKQSTGIHGGDRPSAILESDHDSTDPKEESRFEKITALVADAHRALDLVDAEEGREGAGEAKTALPTVGKLPSVQINRQRSFYIPTKGPAMLSPIYPSGFDILTGNLAKKNLAPSNEPRQTRPRNARPDSANPKNRKYAEPSAEARKKQIGREIGAKEFAKSYLNGRGASILTLKNIFGGVRHDLFGNAGNGHGSTLNGLLSVPAGASLYVSPLSLMLQQPFRALRPFGARLELNTVPLIAGNAEHAHTGDASVLHSQGHMEDTVSNSVHTDSPKEHQPDNYLDSKYLESKVNQRIAKPGSKVDLFRNYLGQINGLNPRPAVRSVVINQPARELPGASGGAAKGSLVIDIVHKAALDDRDETIADVDKEEAARDVREMQDARQAPSSPSARSTCKRMRASSPPFYQFLSKFSDIVVENALRYEAGLRVREEATKSNLERNSSLHDFVNF